MAVQHSDLGPRQARTKMGSPFRYSTGEPVLPGDRVVSDDRRYGVVEWITVPGSELADKEGHLAGGVTVVENAEGVSGLAFHAPENDEGVMSDRHLRFISRGKVARSPYGSGATAWPYEPGPFNGGVREHEGPLTDGERNSKGTK